MRFFYDSILRWRTDAYYKDGKSIDYKAANAKLTSIKKQQYTWLNDLSSVPLQQFIRHQQKAFNHFFEGRAKYPKFKKKTPSSPFH